MGSIGSQQGRIDKMSVPPDERKLLDDNLFQRQPRNHQRDTSQPKIDEVGQFMRT